MKPRKGRYSNIRWWDELTVSCHGALGRDVKEVSVAKPCVGLVCAAYVSEGRS